MENQGSVISLESRQGWLAASKVVMGWGMDIAYHCDHRQVQKAEGDKVLS